ncbi:MAG: ATP-binding cassette domain-containing protein, partial [Eubacteriales bacterium]|nr:ATP-binding cassette domain-containing protein [Eubacteriales bacterium]
MQNIIEVDNVSFQYESQPIFSQVSFSVAAGEFVAIIGANGAGKSTLLRLLLGELAPTSGGIRLFGRDVSAFKDWAKVGYVAQNAYQAASDFPATALEIVLASLSAPIGLLRF